jgi:hypothetical protein
MSIYWFQGLTGIADLPGNFCELGVGANRSAVQQFILELLIPIWFTNLFLMLDGQRPIVQQLFPSLPFQKQKAAPY